MASTSDRGNVPAHKKNIRPWLFGDNLFNNDKLERALALFMVVAWRIAYLMRSGRTCPDIDAALSSPPFSVMRA